MIEKVKSFLTGIKNLIHWFQIIWKDRNYDDYYIWEVLKFKLINQSKYIKKRDWHVNAKYDAERMMLCVKLIDKIQQEYYSSEYMDYHKSEFTTRPCSDREGLYELEIIELEENYEDYFKKHKAAMGRVITNKSLQIFNLDNNYKQRLAMNLGHYNEKRAQNLLFKILNRDIRKWWD